jgi:metallo-beta-lactamase family protein
MSATAPLPPTPVLQFLGAAGTVTGSRFLLSTSRARVLIDCGLYQGDKALRLRNWAPFPMDPVGLDAVVLTHAHLDHTGYLPALVEQGFEGPVYVTRGTADLCRIVLPDSGHIQEEDAAYANRKGFSKHHPALPLYTEEQAERSLASLRVVPFGETLEIAEGVHARFEPAGHILGSATLHLRTDGPDARRLGASGDLGRPQHPLLRPPAPMAPCDALLLESTYGDRHHESEADLERLAELIVRTAARGGVVVIPAFAVDRTEIVLLALARLREAGRIPALPVHVDSPMALAALQVYRRALAEGWDEVRPEMAGVADPFGGDGLHEVRDVEGSKALNRKKGPFIVVSASGMATGGRVLHHLRARLPDARSSVALVGFQPHGTRGRRLLEGERSIKMLGRYVPVRAEVVDLGGFSVHADAEELAAWVGGMQEPPGTVFVVHGEPPAAEALAARLGADGVSAVVAHDGERVRL